MEVVVSVIYEGELAPEEKRPFVAIWTTDPEQGRTVSTGKAVDQIELDDKYTSVRPSVFVALPNGEAGTESTRLAFPIQDPMADICVALYAHINPDPKAASPIDRQRPYVNCIGQINIAWYEVVLSMISNGNALVGKARRTEVANHANVDGTKSDTTASPSPSAAFSPSTRGATRFPEARLFQEITSPVIVDGIRFEVGAALERGEQGLAMYLQRTDPNTLAERGKLKIVASLVATTEKTRNLTYQERLDLLEYWFVARAIEYQRRYRPMPHHHHAKTLPKLEDVELGDIDAMILVVAVNNYRHMRTEDDETYAKVMRRYNTIWESLFTNKRELIIRSAGDPNVHILLKPNAPYMTRFNLPIWNIGSDSYPWAEWWLQMLPGATPHLPEPTAGTEAFFLTLIDTAFTRVSITRAEALETLQNVTTKAATLSSEQLKRYATVGTPEHRNFIKAISLFFHVVMLQAQQNRYSNDSRFVYLPQQHRFIKIDVEHPQHDTVAGLADDADCEDDEDCIAIMSSLLELGRRGHEGRGWEDPLLEAMRCAILLYADFHNFGSVAGAQLSDATDKKASDKEGEDADSYDPEEDEEIIGSRKDLLTTQIGGHTFAMFKSLVVLRDDYIKYKEIVNPIVGLSISDAISKYLSDLFRGWGVIESSAQMRVLQEVWADAPTAVLEGTGRQDPLLLPAEYYYGMGRDLLEMVAERTSEIEVIKTWPAPPSSSSPSPTSKDDTSSSESDEEEEEEEEDRHHHHHRHHKQQKLARARRVSSKKSRSDPNEERSNAAMQAYLSMGEMAPYMWQQRLTIESTFKTLRSGVKKPLHPSRFYNSLGFGCSKRINFITKGVCTHMVWINPITMTYGPALRNALERGGAAILMPLDVRLRQAYMQRHDEDASHITTEYLQYLFKHRCYRITPYDLSFQHLLPSLPANPAGKQQQHAIISYRKDVEEIWSSPLISADEPVIVASRARATSSHPLSTLSKSNESFFFSRAERTFSNDASSMGTTNDSSTLLVPVSPSGTVAKVIRQIAGPSATSYTVQNATGRMVSRPPGGVISKTNIDALMQHVTSGAGITNVEIRSERVLPWQGDTLCAHFKRNVRFVITPEAMASTSSVGAHGHLLSGSHLKGSSSSSSKKTKKQQVAEQLAKLLTKSNTTVEKLMEQCDLDTDVVEAKQFERGLLLEFDEVAVEEDREDALALARRVTLHLKENPGLRSEESGEWIIQDYYAALEAVRDDMEQIWKRSGYSKPSPTVYTRRQTASTALSRHNATVAFFARQYEHL